MRGVEIVVQVKALRRHIRHLAMLVGLLLLAGLVLYVPPLRERAERAADTVTSWLVPTPPQTEAYVNLSTPTATATPTPTSTATATLTPTPTIDSIQAVPSPTPTPPPPPTPTPWAQGDITADVTLDKDVLTVTVIVPPVIYTWFEPHNGGWVMQEAAVSDPIDLESMEVVAQAANAPDVVVELCWPDNCEARQFIKEDSTYILKLTIRLGVNPPLLDPSVRWRVYFTATTMGAVWGDGHTNPRGVVVDKIIQMKGGRP